METQAFLSSSVLTLASRICTMEHVLPADVITFLLIFSLHCMFFHFSFVEQNSQEIPFFH